MIQTLTTDLPVAANDSRVTSIAPIDQPRWRGAHIAVFAGLLWLTLTWVLSGRYVDWRANQELAAAQETLERDISDVTHSLRRNLAILHAIPNMLGNSTLVRETLRKSMSDRDVTPKNSNQAPERQNRALATLDTTLFESAEKLDTLSALWVINRDGNCIASSNSKTDMSFVGKNYATMEFFKAAQNGQQGRQFAAEKTTTPGLLYSTPVFDGDVFLGVVAAKIDLPHLSSWMHQKNAFVADANGVIIFAHDKTLEGNALPDSPVQQLNDKQRLAQYGNEVINEISITPWAEQPQANLSVINDQATPILLVSRVVPEENINVTVTQSVPQFNTLHQDQVALFFITAPGGALLFGMIGCAFYCINRFQRVNRYREHQCQIEYLASHDALTGLFSRAVIDQMINQGIAIAARTGRRLGVLFLDLDMFKDINDSMGHEVGDRVLKEVAQRLTRAVRASDPVVRHGGDEFVILLHDLGSPHEAAHLCGVILEKLRAPFDTDGITLNLSASLGVAIYPDDGSNASILLRNADSALHRAKGSGRADYCFYLPSMNADTMAHLALENELREALIHGQFVLHYQPQYSISKDRVIGCEALVRWQHPTRGLLPPGEFVQATEKSGLIVPLGDWVLREACRQAAIWRRSSLIDFRVAVNLSGIQLRKPGLISSVQHALAESGLAPADLELELTESVLMENTDTLPLLKSLGVSLSIDDFGTGYSSLSYLKDFDADALKIDRSFIKDMETNPSDLTIVKAIISLAKSLNYRVIAEGIETESQMQLLNQLGCHDIQGYWFSRPLPAESFEAFLKLNQPMFAERHPYLSVSLGAIQKVWQVTPSAS